MTAIILSEAEEWKRQQQEAEARRILEAEAQQKLGYDPDFDISASKAERDAFTTVFSHLDLHESSDPWGRPVFKHSAIQALWEGWFARSCIAAPPASEAIIEECAKIIEKNSYQVTLPRFIEERIPLARKVAAKVLAAISRSTRSEEHFPEPANADWEHQTDDVGQPMPRSTGSDYNPAKVAEILTADAAPPEATFQNGDDAMNYLNAPPASTTDEPLDLALVFCREAMRHADIDLSMVLPMVSEDMQKEIRKTLDRLDEARERSLSATPTASTTEREALDMTNSEREFIAREIEATMEESYHKKRPEARVALAIAASIVRRGRRLTSREQLLNLANAMEDADRENGAHENEKIVASVRAAASTIERDASNCWRDGGCNSPDLCSPATGCLHAVFADRSEDEK